MEHLALNYRTNSAINALTAPWLDLYHFGLQFCFYNKREFTYPEDNLVTFLGILSVLNTKFEGGFYQGLPGMFFDIALLWQPYRTV
jgi:hypothetical protein